MQGSPWGGSEELWAQTATRLKQAGHEVGAWVMYRTELAPKITALAQHGVGLETYPSVPYLVGPARRVWDRISLSYRRSYRRLKGFKPDLVVISQGYNGGGFDWAKVCREAAIRYVIVVHCNSEFWWFQEGEAPEAVLSYTNARRVFCVSQGNLGLLRLQVGDPLVNGEVVWNPCYVSAEPAPPWPDEGRSWRFACVGRMDPAPKGQDLLLQTLAKPEWQKRCVEVNFFGTGPYEKTLRRMAEMFQLKNVFFRGHVNDLRAIWAENHMLVLPSRYEGLPLALVEAMWCARPAIVTDVGGNAEVCVDSETGFVAPSATLSSFAAAVERAWKRRTEWKVLGQSARARIEAQMPKDPIGLFCERLMACTSTIQR